DLRADDRGPDHRGRPGGPGQPIRPLGQRIVLAGRGSTHHGRPRGDREPGPRAADLDRLRPVRMGLPDPKPRAARTEPAVRPAAAPVFRTVSRAVPPLQSGSECSYPSDRALDRGDPLRRPRSGPGPPLRRTSGPPRLTDAPVRAGERTWARE